MFGLQSGIQLLFAFLLALVLGTLSGSAVPLFFAWMDDKPARWVQLASSGFLRFAFDEVGGYVHDTAMSQYISAMQFHFSTATITYIAGQVANSIAAHRAAANQTTLITIPITIPSNS